MPLLRTLYCIFLTNASDCFCVTFFLCVTSLVILRKMSKDETLFRVKKMFSLGPQKANYITCTYIKYDLDYNLMRS